MLQKKFQRKIEDFNCLHCGYKTKGNGYTNHCPKCLYSLHVDINPGDRLSPCRGLMRPLAIEKKNGELKIRQKCEVCGHERLNRICPEDDLESFLKALAKN